MATYDVGIIGSGIAGIMCAYELAHERPDLTICVLEKGRPLTQRVCPLTANQAYQCRQCPSCAIMEGFGGCGAFSDGKYNFTSEFGGWLTDFLPPQDVMNLIEYVDQILVAAGATTVRASTYTPAAQKLKRAALQNDLHLLQAEVKHLGTENNRQILLNLYTRLARQVEFAFHTEVCAINQTSAGYRLDLSSGDTLECRYLVAAVGRVGSDWFAEQCRRLGIDLSSNQIDLGVRVELPFEVYQHITDEVYEAKIHYYTEKYNDLVKTFCMNPRGHVVIENNGGLMTVNGHSYSNPDLQSENTNFALLVSNKFTWPFDEPHKYGRYIATLSNMLGHGVLIQRLGDLLKGRRSNEKRMKKCFIRPTLTAANAGDLALVLPKRYLDNIIEMLFALEKIAPGTTNADTLLYGVEVKFYSARPTLDNALCTPLPNFYAIGDGAGITRSLSQSGASGIHAARSVLQRL